MEISVERNLNTAADAVWAVIEDFGDMSWTGAPKFEAIGSGIGMIRRVHMEGMDPINEILESMDAENMTLTYTIPPNDVIPFDNYRATVSVRKDDDGCIVNITTTLDAGAIPEDDARAMMEGTYNMLLDGLSAKVGG